MYKCVCGKQFNSSYAINGHKAGCLVYLSTKTSNARELLNDRYSRSSKSCKLVMKRKSDEISLKHKHEIEVWISEQHKCEKCGKIMTEYYGSGRFCSSYCARGFSNYKPDRRTVVVTDFKCDICNRYFKSQYSLNLHTGLKHPEKAKERLVVIGNGEVLNLTYSELYEYRLMHDSCEICGRKLNSDSSNTADSVRSLCIDHIHSSNTFRGMLCLSCNRALGWFENNREAVLNYLKSKGYEGS